MTLPARPTPTDFDGTRDRVVDLFIRKHSIGYIATALGLTHKAVSKLIDQEFNTRLGDRQAMIHQAVLEIDWLMKPLMKKYAVDSEAGRPSERDFRALLEGNKERRRLLGLDASVKVDVTINDQSEADIQQELARYGVTTKLPPAISEDVEDAEIVEPPSGPQTED